MNWSIRMAESVMQRQPTLGHKWAYEWGVILKGILSLWEATNEPRYFDYIKSCIDHYVEPDGSIRTYRVEEYNLDNIHTGKLLFPLYQATNDPRYKSALYLLRRQLEEQPTTSQNGFWHKQIYPYQMWLDGIYMASPFLTRFAKTFDEPALFDRVANQIKLIYKHTLDAESGLLYHAWEETRDQAWANPETGCSPHFWGRAMGWFVMALIDILINFPPVHPDYGSIQNMLGTSLTALVKVQGANGLWYQILDQPAREGNYPEASASCMIVYAIVKGVRCGYLDPHYLLAAQKGYAAIVQNFLSEDEDGLLNLNQICSVAGLGGNPYRDGSYQYYISEPIVSNDDKGVGAFILASVEMELMRSRVSSLNKRDNIKQNGYF